MLLARQLGTARSHIIVVKGPAVATRGDRLRLGEGTSARYFYIETIENPGNLGRATIYGVEERT
jgi:hypothetical protein